MLLVIMAFWCYIPFFTCALDCSSKFGKLPVDSITCEKFESNLYMNVTKDSWTQLIQDPVKCSFTFEYSTEDTMLSLSCVGRLLQKKSGITLSWAVGTNGEVNTGDSTKFLFKNCQEKQLDFKFKATSLNSGTEISCKKSTGDNISIITVYKPPPTTTSLSTTAWTASSTSLSFFDDGTATSGAESDSMTKSSIGSIVSRTVRRSVKETPITEIVFELYLENKSNGNKMKYDYRCKVEHTNFTLTLGSRIKLKVKRKEKVNLTWCRLKDSKSNYYFINKYAFYSANETTAEVTKSMQGVWDCTFLSTLNGITLTNYYPTTKISKKKHVYSHCYINVTVEEKNNPITTRITTPDTTVTTPTIQDVTTRNNSSSAIEMNTKETAQNITTIDTTQSPIDNSTLVNKTLDETDTGVIETFANKDDEILEHYENNAEPTDIAGPLPSNKEWYNNIKIWIGVVVCCCGILIIFAIYMIKRTPHKTVPEETDSSNVTYENLNNEHNQFPPNLERTYAVPSDCIEGQYEYASTESPYSVPYVERNVNDLYAKPVPKSLRGKPELYSQVLPKSQRQKQSPEPAYSTIGPKTGKSKGNELLYAEIESIDPTGRVSSKIESNYAEICVNSYDNVFNGERYMNAKGSEYAEPYTTTEMLKKDKKKKK